ncbi:MAG: di-heme oxidoredictase family protein, partial [Planctomycetota bacterium]
VASLRAPTHTAEDLGYGPLHPDAMLSPRVANPMIGLGLLEAIPVEDILARADPDDLDGGDLSETITALASDDTVDAGGGQDLVDLGLGDDMGDGGTGIDTLSFASLADPGFVFGDIEVGVLVDLSNQGNAQDTGQGNDIFTNFENLEGSDFDDLLTGDGAANTLMGLGGGDVLNGGAGDDLLEGGEGFDVVEGGAGADGLFGGTGGGSVEGDIAAYFNATGPLVFDFGSSLSEIEAGSSAEVLEDTIGADIEGFAGASNHSNTFLAQDLTGFTLFLGGAEADTIEGGSGVDQILGLAGNDVISGNDGGDALIGEGGDDDLFGGAGSDAFFFDGVDGNDTIHDLELGVDLIFFTGGNFAALSELTLTGVDADDDEAGTGVLDDTLISYEVGGVASSITIIDHDVAAVEAGAVFVFS